MRVAVVPGSSWQARPVLRLVGRLAALALATALVAASMPSRTYAQAAPRFEVVSVTHHPGGRLTAAVQASDPALLRPGSMRVLVDGAERLAQVVNATSVEVMVPPLTIGAHSVTFRAGDKTPIERTMPFEVANKGMLTVNAAVPSDPAAPISLKVTAPVPLASLPLKLRVGMRDWPLSTNGEAMLDPWTILPGVTEVTVVAANDVGVIAQTQLTVTIPELHPVLTVKRDSTPSGERLVINGHVQTTGVQSIVVRADAREVLRAQQPLAQVTVPGSSDVTVELLAGEHVVRSEAFAVGGLFGSVSLPVAAVIAALLLIGVPLLLRRRSALQPSAAVARALQPATVRTAPSSALVAAASQAAEQMTNIIVRTPEGQTRRILVRRGASLTIGSDALCDIRLADDTVRARHGLLSRMEDGHFELHPITGQPGEPAAPTASGRVLLRPGDPVRIGQHVLVIE